MFIETKEPIFEGSELKLAFNLDDGGPVVRVAAEVPHVVTKLGIAVRFVDLSPSVGSPIGVYTTQGEAEKGWKSGIFLINRGQAADWKIQAGATRFAAACPCTLGDLSCQTHQIDLTTLGSHRGEYGSFADLLGLFLASRIESRPCVSRRMPGPDLVLPYHCLEGRLGTF